MNRKYRWTLIILNVCILVAGCASKRDVAFNNDRITVIEQKVTTLEKKVSNMENQLKVYSSVRGEEDVALRTQNAGLRVNLNQLRQEFQTINGRMEEIDYLVKQKIKAFDEVNYRRDEKTGQIGEIISQHTDQIKKIEQYIGFEPGSDLTATPSPQNETDANLNEDGLYKAAKLNFNEDDYDKARERFSLFLKKFPHSKEADNAQFWIAETYYRKKWYEKAILEYQKVVENFPKGNKIAAALLKQGFAFNNIKDNPNARLILQELIKKYPNSSEAKIARKKLKTLK